MKKLLGIIVLGFLLSGCGDSNSSKLYLKCKTIKAGMYVTDDYGTKVNEINYFEIDLKTKKVRSKWDKFNGKFEWNRTLFSVGEKYIKINHLDGEDYPEDNYELLDRETGKMTHPRLMASRSRQTPISMCEKINKGDLPVKKTDKKF